MSPLTPARAPAPPLASAPAPSTVSAGGASSAEGSAEGAAIALAVAAACAASPPCVPRIATAATAIAAAPTPSPPTAIHTAGDRRGMPAARVAPHAVSDRAAADVDVAPVAPAPAPAIDAGSITAAWPRTREMRSTDRDASDDSGASARASSATSRKRAPGSLARQRATPPPAVSTTFDAAMTHTLVDAGSSLCWLDGSHVSCAAKGWATGPVPTPSMLDANTQVPAGWSLVAIAAHGSTVAWAAAPDPNVNTTGCVIWTSENGGAATKVYDGSQASFFCRGLAVDDAYVYVTMNVTAWQYTNTGGTTGFEYIIGSGIARMPLAGGAMQTIPLQLPRWYGPRRVFVDDQYAYAVDPSYVLRVPKSAFGP